MVALVPKTKYAELIDELSRVERLPRVQALSRLAFLERRIDTEIGKQNIAAGERLLLKAKLAAFRGNADQVKSYSQGICSFFGSEGRWDQFNNFIMLGFVKDAYELVCEMPVEGSELSTATWLCVSHALAGNTAKVDECVNYIERAYPKREANQRAQREMIYTAQKLSEFLTTIDQHVDVNAAIQAAISVSVPSTMLSLPGVAYKSSSIESCTEGGLLIDIELTPDNESADELAQISINFSRKLQELLPAEVSEELLICLHFNDESV
ncbi:MAG: hypothetical protein CML20_10315 [Rheinheimera sp.]|mgnify:CR=1 FL=1|uniref:hypothetical protein n=1 Tax=Arsukibacterium sp. UBA3155 TaxID=1946058 RepID=UPI000C8CE552|nr:hypothetical protein [Arsukibacterium sp. UBA3155]MAD75167.1 hypothetical protein [Rheinheimera sp.]|tara:strand:- start:27825 stop:28625 length:801 start_codon:yes stop_codon:yes gene_type:complete